MSLVCLYKYHVLAHYIFCKQPYPPSHATHWVPLVRDFRPDLSHFLLLLMECFAKHTSRYDTQRIKLAAGFDLLNARKCSVEVSPMPSTNTHALTHPFLPPSSGPASRKPTSLLILANTWSRSCFRAAFICAIESSLRARCIDRSNLPPASAIALDHLESRIPFLRLCTVLLLA